jgi:hypothetical protein
MKKILSAFSVLGILSLNGVKANVPDKPCKDKNGKVVECKHSTSKNDSKSERDLDKAGNKVEKGGKHAGYDATHNKATKKTNINEGNQKYKYQNDVK